MEFCLKKCLLKWKKGEKKKSSSTFQEKLGREQHAKMGFVKFCQLEPKLKGNFTKKLYDVRGEK